MSVDINSTPTIKPIWDKIQAANTEIARLQGLVTAKDNEINVQWSIAGMSPSCKGWIGGSAPACNAAAFAKFQTVRRSDGSAPTGDHYYENFDLSMDNGVDAWADAYAGSINTNVATRDSYKRGIEVQKTALISLNGQYAAAVKAYNDAIDKATDQISTQYHGQSQLEYAQGFSDFLSKYGIYMVGGVVLILIVFFYFKYHRK